MSAVLRSERRGPRRPRAAVRPGEGSSPAAPVRARTRPGAAYGRRVPRPRATLLLLALLLAPFLPGAAQAASARPTSVAPVVDVTPDPERQLYAGSGGLVVPASSWRGPGSSRRETAACADCRWRVTRVCTTVESAVGGCRAIALHCPVDTVVVRIWLRRPGQDWTIVSLACLGDTPPRTVRDVGSQVRDRAVVALPPLRAGVQPVAGTLVRLPALFRTGQPARGIRDADISVLGLDVRLTSRVRWHWTYGDGSDEWTTSPGGTWPDTSVGHAYSSAGRFRASVRAVWRAEFTVEGLGPYPVPGPPLTQQGIVPVVVRGAHAHLVR